MTKIVLVNAPFRTYNGKFLNTEVEAVKQKLLRTVQYFFQTKHRLYNQEGYRYGIRAGSRWPWTCDRVLDDNPFPFMLAYTASYLKEAGYDVELIDAVVSGEYSCPKFVKQVKKEKPDIVIIETAAITEKIDLWCAKEISKFAQIALAGPHFTDSIAKRLQKEAPYVKYFLKGEYIKSALTAIKSDKSGIYDSEIVKDLDAIPFPYRGYKNAEKHYELTMPTPKPQLQIYASKGCPFKCKFCMWPQTMYKGNVAQRSPKKIAEEIKLNIKNYGYKSIMFDDDTFNVGTERISELCDYLKEIGLPWTMMGRLDCSPLWLYDKMVDSGCVGMRFGVETFDIECLKRINKGLERVDFQATLKYICDKYPDLWIHLTMMQDMPGQTEEIHQNDMKILKDLGFVRDSKDPHRTFQLSRCVPYEGTVLYSEMEEILGKEYLEKNQSFDGSLSTIMTKLNREGFWDKK